MIILEFTFLLAIGSLVGIIAGLFGTGGGAVVVPTIIFLLNYKNITPDIIPNMAIGTSLATIIFTGIASTRQHYKQGSFITKIFIKLTPGIILGAILGSIFASTLPSKILQNAFAIFLLFVAIQFFTSKEIKSKRKLPGKWVLGMFGLIIGCISSIFGVGGASVSVPILTACSVSVKKAVGTAAGLCLPIAISATVINVIVGWNVNNLPYGSFGYINIPILISLVISSIFFAPIGAKISQWISEKKLKRLFAIFLICVSIKLLLR